MVICLTIRRCHAWVSIHLPSTNSLALQFKGTLSSEIKARANSSRKPGWALSRAGSFVPSSTTTSPPNGRKGPSCQGRRPATIETPDETDPDWWHFTPSAATRRIR